MANYPGGRSRAAEVMVGITDALRDFITRYALGFKTQSTFANAVGGGVTPQRWNKSQEKLFHSWR